jgi:putative sterol carrier protein
MRPAARPVAAAGPTKGEVMAIPPKNVDEVISRAPGQFIPDAAKGFKAVYQYCVTGEGGKDYYFAVDDGKLDVATGKHASPSITITVDHQDLLKMLSNPAEGQMLFMQGKIKVEPMDFGILMKMGQLFRPE